MPIVGVQVGSTTCFGSGRECDWAVRIPQRVAVAQSSPTTVRCLLHLERIAELMRQLDISAGTAALPARRSCLQVGGQRGDGLIQRSDHRDLVAVVVYDLVFRPDISRSTVSVLVEDDEAVTLPLQPEFTHSILPWLGGLVVWWFGGWMMLEARGAAGAGEPAG